jgi:hypothetical protein
MTRRPSAAHYGIRRGLPRPPQDERFSLRRRAELSHLKCDARPVSSELLDVDLRWATHRAELDRRPVQRHPLAVTAEGPVGHQHVGVQLGIAGPARAVLKRRPHQTAAAP